MNKLAFLLLGILLTSSPGQKSELDDIRLVIFFSVDQMSPHLLNQYEPLYTGGFRWLIDHSRQFTNTHYEHGYTATGPGHFVLASGQHPGPNGILGNYWYDRELKHTVSCVEDTVSKVVGYEGDARSYRQINANTLGDWLKNRYPDSKVYSVAGKDRSAAMMGGKHADLALYYNWRGSFVTSSYYIDTLPEWLIKYNKKLNAVSYRDSLWTRSLPFEVYDRYAHEDFFEGESDRYHSEPYSPVFPIGFDADASDKDVVNGFFGFPWMDRATIDLAKVIVQEEGLGQDRNPDILFVGLSATDAIVHDYGPNSHEAMDAMLKIDRYLKNLISTVEDAVGLENVLFVLTSDHGGLALPEYRQKMGLPGGRISRPERKTAIQDVFILLEKHYGSSDFVVNDGLGFYYDLGRMREMDIKKTDVDTIIRESVEKVTGIARVLTKDEIFSSHSGDTVLARLKNSFHPVKSPDLWILQEKYWVTKYPRGTGHGTPYDYDTHVPLLFSKAGQKQTTVSRKIMMVDIAPTIAAMLGINIPKGIDGVPITEMQKQ